MSHKCVANPICTALTYSCRPVCVCVCVSEISPKCAGGSPLTQENHFVVVSGVARTHSNANAAYKYAPTSEAILNSGRVKQESSASFGHKEGFCPEMFHHWERPAEKRPNGSWSDEEAATQDSGKQGKNTC